MRIEEVDVLVVGAGPCGLATAALLSSYGVKVLSISKYTGPAPTPRATLANSRSMEIYRDLGIEEDVRAAGVAMRSLPFNVFATSFAGMELARYRSYGTPADRLSDYAAATPCDSWNVAQHRLEPVLLDAARQRGADVRYATEMLSIEQSAEGVEARLLDRTSGEEFIIRSKFAVGADGGRSQVAEQIGIDFEGKPVERHLLSMWVEADLTKYAAYRPGYLYSIFRPGPDQWFGSGVWLCIKPYTEWLFSLPGTVDVPEDEMLRRAYATIGDADVKIKVKQSYGWKVNHVVASQYRKGRIFIAGDAAHRHPPSGGLGANTSVQDGYNLAWKLAFVLSGQAGMGLLDSYEEERQPVGRYVVERANKSLNNSAPVPIALGFHDDQAEEEGWAGIRTLFEDTPEAADRRKQLDAAVKLGNYRSNALGAELGQHYRSSAIIDDGTADPEPVRDPELYYEPTTRPGAYLPHAWIQQDQSLISTLDIVGAGHFTLIVGIGGQQWKAAAARVVTELGINLVVRSVGPRCEYDDVTGEWAAVSEIGDHGALLVRPDRHIAWRARDLSAEPVAALVAAMRRTLDRPADGQEDRLQS